MKKIIDYKIFTQAVHKIALKKPDTTSYKKFSTGKRPHISFKENPRDYRGLNDKNYGTGFQTNYLKPFEQYFCVLDIDNYKDTEYNILGAIPEKSLQTHTSKTQSGGMHLYFLSKEPLKIHQNMQVPLDLKCVREHYLDKDKKLVVGNWCWKQKYDEYGEVNYIKRFYKHDNRPLKEIDINILVEMIYDNLGVRVKEIKPSFKKKNKIKYRGDANLEKIYPIISSIFEDNLNSKHMNAYRLNCRLHMFSDEERLTLANWLKEDYGECMEDINNFLNEFTKRG